MESWQTFLKAELQTLAQKCPDRSPKERLKMARETCAAQNFTLHQKATKENNIFFTAFFNILGVCSGLVHSNGPMIHRNSSTF